MIVGDYFVMDNVMKNVISKNVYLMVLIVIKNHPHASKFKSANLDIQLILIFLVLRIVNRKY